MDGYTPIRNGIIEHLEEGRLSPLEFSIYTLLHLRADWATGIYRGCALTIAYQFGNPRLQVQTKDALLRLKRKGYINYSPDRGRKGAYEILIHKYEPREGRLIGTRLNAWKYDGKAVPEYESLASDSPDTRLMLAGRSPESRTIQELRSKEVQETNTTAVAQQSPDESPKAAPKKPRRTKTVILGAYPDTVSAVVNRVLSTWPKVQPNGEKIHADLAAFANRVDQVLRDNTEATPELLIAAAEKYLSEPKRFYKAPQFFFGPGNGTDAAWVAYARMILHRAGNSPSTEAVQ